MSKHTPGPWYFFSTPIGIGASNIQERDMAWTRHDGAGLRDSHRSREEDEANARLIAAAPDLLAALKEIASIGPASDAFANLELAREIARAAIAKATTPALTPAQLEAVQQDIDMGR
jgi:hypothetical protein